jgi:hypothetical protein
MFKITLITSLLASSAAFAAPQKIKFDPEAIKREQRIAELSRAPASALNICKKC